MNLSIIIPVFNKFNFTKSCLDDLFRLPKDHEIIVVDNASTDETNNKLSKMSEITYIRNEQNLGFAKACNIGYRVAKSNNVLFLNNDIRVKSNFETWTQPLIDKCDDGLVGPTMGLLDKNFNFIKESNEQLDGLSYMSGWCLASSKNIFDKLDLSYGEIFNEKFFAYFEDTDLSFRARKLNIGMSIVDVPVFHFGKQTTKQLNTYDLYLKSKKLFLELWN